MGLLSDIFGGGGDDAADAATYAANLDYAGRKEALDYLKEVERLPRQYREAALGSLAGLYGLPGGTGGSQQQYIEQAMTSPLYQSLMGGREAGEEAILRSAGATGGLRSGNVQGALYDYNTQLQNQALLQAYNQQLQGLQGLAGLPSYAPQIAQGMAGLGQTQAQGVTAAAQAQQMGRQQGISNLFGLGQLGILAGGLFSDRRLKSNIKNIGKINGHNWYTWTWNSVANMLGLNGECQGCLADEVYKKNKKAVIMKDNFLFVLYNDLGIFPAEG